MQFQILQICKSCKFWFWQIGLAAPWLSEPGFIRSKDFQDECNPAWGWAAVWTSIPTTTNPGKNAPGTRHIPSALPYLQKQKSKRIGIRLFFQDGNPPQIVLNWKFRDHFNQHPNGAGRFQPGVLKAGVAKRYFIPLTSKQLCDSFGGKWNWCYVCSTLAGAQRCSHHSPVHTCKPEENQQH